VYNHTAYDKLFKQQYRCNSRCSVVTVLNPTSNLLCDNVQQHHSTKLQSFKPKCHELIL
jgi:hypothetical protein